MQPVKRLSPVLNASFEDYTFFYLFFLMHRLEDSHLETYMSLGLGYVQKG